MGKFRVTYKNSWKELKTIIIEGTYWDIFRDVKMMFGEENIISVEDTDPKPEPDYSISKFAEFPDYYGDISNYDD